VGSLVAAAVVSGVLTGLLDAGGASGSSASNLLPGAASVAVDSSSAAPFKPAAIFASAAPAVVAITASGVTTTSNGFPLGGSSQSQVTTTGTGFVIDPKADILTASHVIAGASSITVKFQDGTARTAKVLGSDGSTDVSVMKVEGSRLKLQPLALGDTRSLMVGDPLAVIGDPFGYVRSLSTGVVSALDRTIQAPDGYSVAHAIQTDAVINPGNSGGPVLDARGEVVGITDQIATGGSGARSTTGVGFAIPINVVKAELPQLEAGARVTHPYLGVSTEEGSINSQGAMVASVAAGSPAADAGLRAGDLITALNGHDVTGPSQLVGDVSALKPGDKITLTVERGSSTLRLSAALGTQSGQAPTG
jgi:putative serine protease PepD